MTDKEKMKYVFYWFEEAKISLDVAKSLYKSKKYAETLFFGHLTLEKILKSIVVFQTNKHAPFTHDLVSLAEKGRMAFIFPADMINTKWIFGKNALPNLPKNTLMK